MSKLLNSASNLIDYLLGCTGFSCCNDLLNCNKKSKKESARSEQSARLLEHTERDLVDDGAEEFEDEFESSECVEEGGPNTRLLNNRNIPNKKVKRMKSHMRKVNYTGSVAAPPPYNLKDIIGPMEPRPKSKVKLGAGVYLVYSTENNGCLKRVYSDNPPEVNVNNIIIAYSIPQKQVSTFKYEQKEHILISDLAKILVSDFVNDRNPFYLSWIEYIKEVNSFNSILYLLPGLTLSPPPAVQLVCVKKNGKIISELPIDEKIMLNEYSAIAVLPVGISAIKLGVTTPTQLNTIANIFGAIAEL